MLVVVVVVVVVLLLLLLLPLLSIEAVSLLSCFYFVSMAALTYAGLMSAGPFFVSDADLRLGLRTVVLDVDKMACYVAEKVRLRSDV